MCVSSSGSAEVGDLGSRTEEEGARGGIARGAADADDDDDEDEMDDDEASTGRGAELV